MKQSEVAIDVAEKENQNNIYSTEKVGSSWLIVVIIYTPCCENTLSLPQDSQMTANLDLAKIATKI